MLSGGIMDTLLILEKLKEILLAEDSRKADAIMACTPETRLKEDLGLTSVSLLYMVMEIEDAFDIRFENVGLTSFDTVGSVINYIKDAK